MMINCCNYSQFCPVLLLYLTNLIQWGESCHTLPRQADTVSDDRWATSQQPAGSLCPHLKPGCRCLSSLSGGRGTVCSVLHLLFIWKYTVLMYLCVYVHTGSCAHMCVYKHVFSLSSPETLFSALPRSLLSATFLNTLSQLSSPGDSTSTWPEKWH